MSALRKGGRGDRRRLSRPRIPGELGDPVTIGDAAAMVGEQLGLAEPRSFTRLLDAWAEIAGPAIAAHSRVRGVRRGTLEVVVDSAAWATQLRYLETDLVERAAWLVGPGVVETVRVVVEAPGRTSSEEPGSGSV